jgi:hypothetical protein
VSTIVVGGETLTLLPEKAVLVSERRTLLVADERVAELGRVHPEGAAGVETHR